MRLLRSALAFGLLGTALAACGDPYQLKGHWVADCTDERTSVDFLFVYAPDGIKASDINNEEQSTRARASRRSSDEAAASQPAPEPLAEDLYQLYLGGIRPIACECSPRL